MCHISLSNESKRRIRCVLPNIRETRSGFLTRALTALRMADSSLFLRVFPGITGPQYSDPCPQRPLLTAPVTPGKYSRLSDAPGWVVPLPVSGTH